jgi:hypothetical protein
MRWTSSRLAVVPSIGDGMGLRVIAVTSPKVFLQLLESEGYRLFLQPRSATHLARSTGDAGVTLPAVDGNGWQKYEINLLPCTCCGGMVSLAVNINAASRSCPERRGRHSNRNINYLILQSFANFSTRFASHFVPQFASLFPTPNFARREAPG